jgi:hypothetical protein
MLPDLTGPRMLALGAGVGAAEGTEALFVNPAALAAKKRYSVDAMYLTDRRPGLDGKAARQDWLASSVVDNSTTQVAAGFAYAKPWKGLESGMVLRLGLAGTVTEGLLVGVQGNYVDLGGADRVKSTFNMDAGVLYQVTKMVSVGAAGYNLIHTKHDQTLPQAFGAGFTAGWQSLRLVGDWRFDLDRTNPDGKKRTSRYGGGLEYLFDNAVPVRAGFEIDDTSKTKWWSAGLGYVSNRMAVDVGYRQSLTRSDARTVSVALRVFVPNE